MRLILLIASLCLSFSCFGQRLFDPNLVLAIPSASGYTYDAATLTYGTAITNNSGTINSNDFYAVDQFVKSAKANNYWTNILDCSPLAGNQTNASVVKLVVGNAALTKLALKGSITSADYTTTNGWSNPSTHWLDTGFYSTNFPATNHGLSVWITLPLTNLTATSEGPIGHDTAPSGNGYRLIVSGTPPVVTGQSLNQLVTAPNNQWNWYPGVGLWGETRTANNAAYTYQNGYLAFTNTTVAADVTNSQPITLLGTWRYYSSAPTVWWVNKPIGWYCIDNGMPITVLSNYYADVRTLMKAIGRCGQFPFTQPTYLIIGQSLAVGGGSGGDKSEAGLNNTNDNSKTLFNGGQIDPVDQNVYPGPRNTRATYFEFGAETGWRAFGDHLFYLCTNNGYGANSNGVLITDWAKSAVAYTVLKKGSATNYTIGSVTTNVYQHSLNDLNLMQTFQNNVYGQNINVAALLCCHGESDITTTGYTNNLYEWIANYQSDITAVTGQTNLPPMFLMQPTAMSYPSGGASSYPYSSLAMLSAHENSSGSNILVGARYNLVCQTPDNTHLYNKTYVMQGEYFAEAVYGKLIANNGWECLRPTNIARAGATITVTFNKPGLILDTTLVTAANNYGFTYTNNSSPPAISSVALAGATTNQATITLASDPGVSGTLRYAMNSTNGSSGPVTGGRGNIRDAYTGVGSLSGSNLYNWCVMFEKTTP